ncbi:hypothetical protein HU200_045582 [Digitaria exilis]|uniref:RNase H type-1 domain-containing protein n=1 Tax=Digitaria exilis TaxID=1010633 RepID=A0A835B7K0_9POAL|nr:hypothetical protein HU200_045582 [Digitaria exilis]
MWTLWMARNSTRHGPVPSRHALYWVRDTAFDLWQMTKKNQTPDPTVPTPRWKKSKWGWAKCNTDAAFQEDSHTGATSGVIRDDYGVCIAARARWIHSASTAWWLRRWQLMMVSNWPAQLGDRLSGAGEAMGATRTAAIDSRVSPCMAGIN